MNKILKRSVAFMLLAAFMLLVLALPHASAYDIKQVWARFSATAGETLTTGQVVAIKDSDGYAYKADADVAAVQTAVGVVGKGASSGSKVEIITLGILSGWSSLGEGSPGYLSATAGAVTQTAPSALQQQVAVAISTTEYFFTFQAASKGYFTIALSINGQETATVNPAATFQMPFAATLVEVSVAARDIDTADADETYTVDLEEAGTTVLSSAISITADNTPVVGTVSDSAIADNAKMEVVLTIGGTTPTIDDLTVLLTFKVAHTT